MRGVIRVIADLADVDCELIRFREQPLDHVPIINHLARRHRQMPCPRPCAIRDTIGFLFGVHRVLRDKAVPEYKIPPPILIFDRDNDPRRREVDLT